MTSVIYTVFKLQGQLIVLLIKRIKYFVINEFLYNGSKWELGRTRYKRVIYNQLLLYLHVNYLCH